MRRLPFRRPERLQTPGRSVPLRPTVLPAVLHFVPAGLVALAAGPSAAEAASVIVDASPAAVCGGGVVGAVEGRALGIAPEEAIVVLYSELDRLYVQPWADERRRTRLAPDGSFEVEVRGGCRYWVVLADSAWSAPVELAQPPAPDDSVFAVACTRSSAPCSTRTVEFDGSTWIVRSSCCPQGPGPNVFSDAEASVRRDAGGLVLRIEERDGVWQCAEVIADSSSGYGEYLFRLDSRVDALPHNVVAAAFLYENDDREIDIEFAGDGLIPGPENAQYVVQPYWRPGNLHAFTMPAAERTSHRIVWSPDTVSFESWLGWGGWPPDPADRIAEWIYAGPDVPPAGAERFHFNLWLVDGNPPGSGADTARVAFADPVVVAAPPRRDLNPDRLAFRGVFPNPLRDGGRIEFSVERPGPVSLELFDSRGRRVSTILSAVVAEGSHAVDWRTRAIEAAELPSGVYWLVLRRGGDRVARRVVLLP